MKWVASPYSEYDRYLVHQGTHYESYTFMGGHLVAENGVQGARFAVWAPNAQRVSVVGDFNNWDGRRHPMEKMPQSGIWALFVPGLEEGDLYKYEILTKEGHLLLKADPFAFWAEKSPRPHLGFVICTAIWDDQDWQQKRQAKPFQEPCLFISTFGIVAKEERTISDL